MQKTIKVLFDANLLATAYSSTGCDRSGIYWVAHNILLQFSKNKLYEVTLVGIPVDFKSRYTDNFLLSFPNISAILYTSQYRHNIEVHKNFIKETKNIFLIGIRILKIIKNIILLSLRRKDIKKCYNYDVYFSPIFTIPEFIRDIPSIKIFHILYDCIPLLEDVSNAPLNNDHWFSQVFRNLNKKIFYFCISDYTRSDFLKYAPKQLDKHKMFETPIATSQSFSPNYDKNLLEKVLSKYNINQKPGDCYIFTLCSLHPRKGIIFTIKCFIKFIKKHKIDNLYFYQGGGRFDEYYEQLSSEIDGFDEYKQKFILLGYVDDEDINILYSNSIFFTFLSQYEGFGLPPLEAMQAGTPVICSNNTSLPEVVGDAAITITCNDENACIKAFEDFYFNENLRKEYVNKGLDRAKLFSWEKTFNMMNDIIMKVI